MPRFFIAAFAVCCMLAPAASGAAPQDGVERYHVHGRVTQVDASRGVIIIHHPPIEELDWEEMTMAFPIVDRTQLSPLRPGDEVQFDLIMPDDVATIETIAAIDASHRHPE